MIKPRRSEIPIVFYRIFGRVEQIFNVVKGNAVAGGVGNLGKKEKRRKEKGERRKEKGIP